ncbi:MAG: hypothetical protein ACKVT2_15940 [Saprospiraceae bacterium]
MFSNKLISILQILSKVERNRFRKYLLSPYLNDQPDLVSLFDITENALREGIIDQLKRQEVWQKLCPKKPYNDAQMRRLASDLNQMALRFLSAEARKQNPLAEALELQQILEKPELKKQLAGVERNILRLLDETPGQSPEYYLACFQVHHNVFIRAAKTIVTSGYAEKLWTADTHLEYFYLTQKLKYYVNWLLYSRSRTTEKELALPFGLWEILDRPPFNKVALLIIYRKIIECLTEPENEQRFKNLLDTIEFQGQALSKSDLRECYQIAQNYCAIKINQGVRTYYREMFNIFKKIIQKDVLLEAGNLSEGLFKNIVTVGLGVGEFEWTESFIDKYTANLPSDIRENARTFNLASLHFHQKKFHQVIELIRDVEYSDVVYTLSTKQLLVRTYYELDETLALDSLIDSFKIFLRRNKLISKSQKREYLNFLNFVKNLTILNANESRKVAKLQTRIEKSSSITPKKWLLEKIDELHKK